MKRMTVCKHVPTYQLVQLCPIWSSTLIALNCDYYVAIITLAQANLIILYFQCVANMMTHVINHTNCFSAFEDYTPGEL